MKHNIRICNTPNFENYSTLGHQRTFAKHTEYSIIMNENVTCCQHPISKSSFTDRLVLRESVFSLCVKDSTFYI